MFRTKYFKIVRRINKTNKFSYLSFMFTKTTSSKNPFLLTLFEKDNLRSSFAITRTYVSKYLILNFADEIRKYDKVVSDKNKKKWDVFHGKRSKEILNELSKQLVEIRCDHCHDPFYHYCARAGGQPNKSTMGYSGSTRSDSVPVREGKLTEKETAIDGEVDKTSSKTYRKERKKL